MNIHVLSDEDGNILSTGFLDRERNLEDNESFEFGPVAEENQIADTTEVPTDFTGRLTDVTLDDYVEKVQSQLKGRGRKAQ